MEAQHGRGRRAGSGLIIGKFLPPHAGHLHLIDVAAGQVERLTVLVCSLEREPIPGATRLAWLRELRPDVEFLPHADENPQEPHEHPRFWEIWTESIRRLVPRGPDLVFSSETYGEELARRLGASHVMVDAPRRAVPVSGARIRQSPLAHWEHLPPPVRPWFVARVAIVGSESTGKTTLARALAERWKTAWVPEFARGYLDAKGPVAAADPGETAICTLADIEPIGRGQIASEDRLARECDRVLFCDTDLAVTEVWSREYFGTVPAWVAETSRQPRYALTLLTGIDVPYEADWQRDRPHAREEMHAKFRAALEERGRRYVELTGPHEARLAAANAAIERVLGIRPRA